MHGVDVHTSNISQRAAVASTQACFLRYLNFSELHNSNRKVLF